MPAEGSPYSGTTRVLAVDVTPARADDVAEALRELIRELPAHPGILPIIDAGVEAGRAFIVTPPVPGDSLDAALSVYGPAVLADALPRLQQLADALDLAAAHGLCHGVLTPSDIIVSAEDTFIVGIGVAGALSRVGAAVPSDPCYAAPEVLNNEGVFTPAADQYALAMIAYEWLFGGRLDAGVTMSAAAMRGVDNALLVTAFGTATAVEPARRFAHCTDFVRAIADSAGARPSNGTGENAVVVPGPVELGEPADELPLHITDHESLTPDRSAATDVADSPGLTVVPEVTSDVMPDLVREPVLSTRGDAAITPPLFMASTQSDPRSYGIGTLVATLLIGLVLGATAMWIWAARTAPNAAAVSATQDATSRTATPNAAGGATTPDDRAATPNATGPGATPNAAGPAATPNPAGPAATPNPAGPGFSPGSPREVTEAVINPPDDGIPAKPAAKLAPDAARAAQRDAALLVHSVPAGASVAIDGVARGTTPLAIRGLDLGARNVVVTRPGYGVIERRVVLTSERPSRTLEIELTPLAESVARPPRPASEGSVVIDSRPAGAAVTVDGRAAGITPLTLTLAPGAHVVRLERPGYRSVTTRVEVKPGERTRVAARLEGGQDEE